MEIGCFIYICQQGNMVRFGSISRQYSGFTPETVSAKIDKKDSYLLMRTPKVPVHSDQKPYLKWACPTENWKPTSYYNFIIHNIFTILKMTVTNNNPEKTQFLKSLQPENVEPLWTVMSSMVPPVPQPKATPTLWKYMNLRPLLEDAGRLIPEEESERRVLMLVNPSLNAPQTTDTLYAGLQYINSGEVAPAHRHSAFALRFIIEGKGGWTAVEGEKLYMERGDVILTPRWKWHDHGKDGEGPMVWLDGLDLPIFQSIPVNFAENYDESRYPSNEVETSAMKYPWSDVQKNLDSVKEDHAIYTYEFQTEKGQPLSSIIGGQAEKVDVGASSPVRQETSSFVFHVYEGQGHTIITEDNGNETVIEWESNDTFCIPSWRLFKHVNEGKDPAYLFSFSDTPLLKNLSLNRAK